MRVKRKHKNQLTLQEFQVLLARALHREDLFWDEPYDLYALALEAAVEAYLSGDVGNRPLRYQLRFYKEHGCFDFVVPV